MQNPAINATLALFTDVIYTNKIKTNLNKIYEPQKLVLTSAIIIP